MMAEFGRTTCDTSTTRIVFNTYESYGYTTVLLVSPNSPLGQVQRRVDALFQSQRFDERFSRPASPTLSQAASVAERARERMHRFLASRTPSDSACPKPASAALRARAPRHWMVHRERCHTRSGRRIPAKNKVSS